MSSPVVPYSLKDAPALIERLLPVQKLSAESYKEQMANQGKTLTALGSYWKGRKPLILARACLLGCLLPATSDDVRDLEIYEMLMGMDDASLVARAPKRPSPEAVLATVAVERISDCFVVNPSGVLPAAAPVDLSDPRYRGVKVSWRADLPEAKRRALEAQAMPAARYRERVAAVRRPEEVGDSVHAHIWAAVNEHLGTSAQSFPELVEQLGIMRYGHRPRMGDAFSGSGQIPFEAARLGLDVYASDLNPIACLLTWGALHIVGASQAEREALAGAQAAMLDKVQQAVDALEVESDGNGWQAKAFLYCVEVTCPQSGWQVPLMPSLIISRGKKVVARLVADPAKKRYDIEVVSGVSDEAMAEALRGTVRTDGRGKESYMYHVVDGQEYKTKISTLRGDYKTSDGTRANQLRPWGKQEFSPRPEDIFRERLYAIHWMRPRNTGKSFDYEFRAVMTADLEREKRVITYIRENILDWQQTGYVPNLQIESGYNTDQPARERGWTHWQHLFNPRQLLVNGLINRHADSAALKLSVCQVTNWNSRLSLWHNAPGVDSVNHTFYNQALNTLYNYGTRSSRYLDNQACLDPKSYPFGDVRVEIACCSAAERSSPADIFITDPPYGDAVNYDEILDFFIAWLRKNPPEEFAGWVWDSRRAHAIKGSDEGFRQGMVEAYRRLAELMPDNGIQVIMFTHQSGSIWGDMANIVWASGLQVTAAWYVVTETDSALREGSYVKGTVLLVLRKRRGQHKTTRDDLAWELEEEVERQIKELTGLNQQARGLYRDENVFADADLQMAGYAAALRVLTYYTRIDGRDMPAEAVRPRTKGETTFVDSLIAFAVDTANRYLVPAGISSAAWKRLSGAERFYLKMLAMEAQGLKALDSYQNFAKAFKVRDFRPLMGGIKANDARLKSAVELGRSEMGEGSELRDSVLRAVLYALMELQKEVDGTEVMAHLMLNVPDYYSDLSQRELAVELADYLASQLLALRPAEATAARVLRELIKHQRLG